MFAFLGDLNADGQSTIVSENGYNLNVYFNINNPACNKVSVLCHGYLSHANHGMLTAIAKAGFMNTVRVDFHGCGKSTGDEKWSFGGYWKNVEDIRTVVTYLRTNGLEVESLIGHSRGGDEILMYGMKYDDVPHLVNMCARFYVSDSTMVNFTDAQLTQLSLEGVITQKASGGKKYQITQQQIDERIAVDMAALCKQHRMPNVKAILTLHGTTDPRIPYTEALEFCKLLDQSKHRIIPVPGGTHSLWDKPDTCELVVDSIRKFIGGEYTIGIPAAEALQPDPSQLAKERDAQRRRLLRVKRTAGVDVRPGTPEAVAGRKHADIQTDSYLEELTDRFVEFEAETQTDFLIDRPASPMFMPAKIGVDAKTQIYDGDLFDFNREVEPILEVLVGKTLEQSMMEVLEEEELREIRRHQEEFERQRLAELLEVQRMEAAELRRAEERARRRAQAEARVEQHRLVQRKVLARTIAREMLLPLRDRAINTLRERGAMVDEAVYEVETRFLPQVVNQAVDRVSALRSVHARLLEDLLQNALKQIKQQSAENIKVRADDEEARVESLREAERERLRKIKEEEERIERERLEEIRRQEEEAEQERLRLEEEARLAEEEARAAMEGEEGDADEGEEEMEE